MLDMIAIRLKQLNNLRGRAFAQILRVGLISGSQRDDLRIREIAYRPANLSSDQGWHLIVNEAGSEDQARIGRVNFFDEPGVDGNAVSTHTNTGHQNIDARVFISQRDGVSTINIEIACHCIELVSQRDINIAVGILHQLD